MRSYENSLSFDRREVLKLALGTTALSLSIVGGTSIALADKALGRKIIENLLKGQKAATKGISLNVPEIAENGNSVPMTVIVDSPMSEDAFVKTVHVIATENPTPHVASFHFTPLSGRARAFTRIRLAKTQNITAIAEMSDGSFRTTTALIEVTVGGCAPG